MITLIDNNEYSNYSTYIHELFSGCSSYFAIFFLNLDEIYYENRFLKIFQSFSKATPTYWKEMRG